MCHQFIQNLTGQHITAERGFVHNVAHFRLGVRHDVFQFGRKIPAILTLNAVLDRQAAALPRGQVVVLVGITGKEHPVPGLRVCPRGFCQVRHIGLRLCVGQCPGNKIFLHINHKIKGDFFVIHSICSLSTVFSPRCLYTLVYSISLPP